MGREREKERGGGGGGGGDERGDEIKRGMEEREGPVS